jgi:hypothetical protein
MRGGLPLDCGVGRLNRKQRLRFSAPSSRRRRAFSATRIGSARRDAARDLVRFPG